VARTEEGEQNPPPLITRVLAEEFQGECMEALRSLVEDTGASIVLSSTWRLAENDLAAVNLQLETHRIAQCVGCTGQDACGLRALEILAWVDEHHPRNFVILDDSNILSFGCLGDTVIGRLEPCFVRIDGRIGLQKSDLGCAKTILTP